MRVLIDTNVLARAAGGPPSPADALVRLCIEPAHVLILSEFLLVELSRVLRYDRMRAIHGLDDDGINRYLNHLERAGIVVAAPAASAATIVPNDPKDDPIILAATAGQAEVLCTLDRHLRHPAVVAFCRAHSIEVLDDVKLLRRLREGASPSEMCQ